jgi:hypothetical protein
MSPSTSSRQRLLEFLDSRVGVVTVRSTWFRSINFHHVVRKAFVKEPRAIAARVKKLT